jgi:hypothetical protein
MSRICLSRAAKAALGGIVLLMTYASLALGNQDKPATMQPQASPPAGSDKAVAAFHKAFPAAVLDEVVRPEDNFYAGSGDNLPLYWTIRYHLKDQRNEARITPDGLLVRKQERIDTKDLPPAVAEGVKKALEGATLKSLQRQETAATLKYAALEEPEVAYAVDVEKDGKTVHVSIQADGSIRRSAARPAGGEEEEEEEEKEEAPAAAAAKDKETKEFAVPDEARRAVKAVKEVFPQAVVQDVEYTAYDDGTGHVQTIYFEVEFVLKGQGKTLLVTPEGVILHLDRPVDAQELPKSTADALAKEVPGGVIKSVTKREIRAGLKFAPLEQSRVIYLVELEKQDKTSTVKLSPDGTKIEPFNPWGRP